MPQLTTVLSSKGQGVRGGGEEEGRGGGGAGVESEDGPHVWMEGTGEEQEERRKQQRVGPLCRGWLCVALAGVLWSVCQQEAPFHPSLCLSQLGWRLLLLGLGLGSCALVLRTCLGLGHRGVVAAKTTKGQCSASLNPRSPEGLLSLAGVLADSLVLCLLQEPLLEPTMPHIQALLCRLETVSQALEPVYVQTGSVEASEGASHHGGGHSALLDSLRHLHTYLQQRASRLHSLLQEQSQYEASLGGLQMGLEQLWTRLEVLHTQVTLTKEGEDGSHENLHTVQRETQCLSTEELVWGHTHTGCTLQTSIESVWPELLQQSNMELLDKVQESCWSLEQQTSTFQAHLHGLRDTSCVGPPLSLLSPVSPLSHATPPPPGQPSTTPSGHLPPSLSATPTPIPLSSDGLVRLSLWKRSALQLSSTISCFSTRTRRKSHDREQEVFSKE
ncbi:uncharacterized protein si:ch211-151h10.2 isoform X2 [Hypomesus transpacificus]|uniref:uncharacterized protein si:ch211-151h10.2 isoform X2 n=1 Tax=Hypomesus transpacificus TaxID=137520 RepID=UPI001F078D78|nr:uncharacterized protein si:ch211-151h10.2 isoform X2 [Hypomesus transpacificus]